MISAALGQVGYHLWQFAVCVGDEQIQLNRFLALFPVANEDKALFCARAPGLPMAFEKIASIVQVTPAFSPFHHALEFGKTLEWDADGEFHAFKH